MHFRFSIKYFSSFLYIIHKIDFQSAQKYLKLIEMMCLKVCLTNKNINRYLLIHEIVKNLPRLYSIIFVKICSILNVISINIYIFGYFLMIIVII